MSKDLVLIAHERCQWIDDGRGPFDPICIAGNHRSAPWLIWRWLHDCGGAFHDVYGLVERFLDWRESAE